MDGAAGEDDGGEGGVGAAVDGEMDLAGEEFAFGGDGGADAGAGGVALGGGGHVFGAVVDELDGAAGLHGEQGGVGADDGGEVFLAAEGAAGLGLDDAALFGREIEDEGEGVDKVEGALHAALDGDGVECSFRGEVRFGDHAVGLDVELLLGSGAVLAFEDEVGVLPDLGRGLAAVLLHEVGFEGVGVGAVLVAPDDVGVVAGVGGAFGVFDGEDAGEFVVGDVDGAEGGEECGFGGVGEKEDGLFGVIDVGVSEAGMIFGEMNDGVFAGDVFGGDDGVLVPGNFGGEGDAGDAAAGDRGADGGAMEHAGEIEVIDVLGATEHLGGAFLAEGGAADDLLLLGVRLRHRRCLRGA